MGQLDSTWVTVPTSGRQSPQERVRMLGQELREFERIPAVSRNFVALRSTILNTLRDLERYGVVDTPESMTAMAKLLELGLWLGPDDRRPSPKQLAEAISTDLLEIFVQPGGLPIGPMEAVIAAELLARTGQIRQWDWHWSASGRDGWIDIQLRTPVQFLLTRVDVDLSDKGSTD